MKEVRMIVLVLIFSLSLGILLNACSSREAIALPSDIAERLMDEVKLPKGVLITDTDSSTKNLAVNLIGDDFSPQMFSGYAIYPSSFTSNVSEFGILKVKDSAFIPKAKEFAERRIEQARKDFAYDKNQSEIADNGEVRINGNYVYYSITEDNNRIFNVVYQMLNDK